MTAPALLLTIGGAALGGLALFAVVAVLCRLAGARLSPSVRFWLWWAVPAKLLLGLLPFIVALPILPTASPRANPAVTVAVPARPVSPTAPAQKTEPIAAPAATAPERAAPRSRHRPFLRPMEPLALLWLLGAIASAGLDLRAAIRLRRRLGSLHGDPETRVVETPHTQTPLVVGLWRPTIILPVGLDERERAAALAHERAHLARGDLWLAIVPTIARWLFWFLPAAAWAARECDTAREEACDAAARAATGVSPIAYGQLLLRSGGIASGAGSAGMASTAFRQLRRRMVALERPARPLSRGAGGALALAGFGGLTPWRPTTATARPTPPPRTPPYRVIDLGTLGGSYSDAFGINDSGQIVGSASDARGNGRAFLWEAGRMRDLGTFGRGRSVAYGVSENGEVALTAFRQARYPHAPRAAGEVRLRGFPFALVRGINASGVMVGGARQGIRPGDALPTRAFAASGPTVRDLGTLGGPYSHAFAISDSGQIVGKADRTPRPRALADALGIAPVATHAFLWEAGRMRDLGTLPGGDNSRAHAVNARGQVAGVSESANGARAFLWEADRMRDLGTLPGGGASVAHGLAADGTTVGSATDATGHACAALWRPGDDSPTDLNVLLPAGSGWHLETARALNARGEIVGQGVFRGRHRAFVLRPR